MKSENQIKQLAKDIRIEPDAVIDERVLTYAEAILAKSTNKQDVATLRRPSIRRKIMRSPITKLAAAAIIVIACVIGSSLWRNTSSGAALADVLASIEQVKAYAYQISIATSMGTLSENTVDYETSGRVVVSPDYGAKMILDAVDPDSGQRIPQELFVLTQNKAVITVLPTKKQYTRMSMDETIASNLEYKNRDPKTVVQRILDCNHVPLGQSVIEGIVVDGFQTTDPNYAGGSLGQVDVKIWINVETQLPVRIDMNLQMNDQTHQRIVMDNYHWDIVVDAHEFDPNIPSDFTLFNHQDKETIGVDEDTAIAGLKFFADYLGFYPKNLHIVSLLKEMQERSNADTEESRRIQQTMERISEEEKSRMQKSLLPTMIGLSTFSTMMGAGNQGYAYYGEHVTPADTNQVLMRWKIADNEYRIIFGDLSVGSATAEELATLEQP